MASSENKAKANNSSKKHPLRVCVVGDEAPSVIYSNSTDAQIRQEKLYKFHDNKEFCEWLQSDDITFEEVMNDLSKISLMINNNVTLPVQIVVEYKNNTVHNEENLKISHCINGYGMEDLALELNRIYQHAEQKEFRDIGSKVCIYPNIYAILRIATNRIKHSHHNFMTHINLLYT